MTWTLESSDFMQWYCDSSNEVIDKLFCCSYLEAQVCGEAEAYIQKRGTTLPSEWLYEDELRDDTVVRSVAECRSDASERAVSSIRGLEDSGVLNFAEEEDAKAPVREDNDRAYFMIDKEPSPSSCRRSPSFMTGTTASMNTTYSYDSVGATSYDTAGTSSCRVLASSSRDRETDFDYDANDDGSYVDDDWDYLSDVQLADQDSTTFKKGNHDKYFVPIEKHDRSVVNRQKGSSNRIFSNSSSGDMTMMMMTTKQSKQQQRHRQQRSSSSTSSSYGRSRQQHLHFDEIDDVSLF